MSKKDPVFITIKEELEVLPEEIYRAEVVKSGNGAVVKCFKRFLGQEAIVIIRKKEKED